MFSLTIAFGPANITWTLMFRTEDSAVAASVNMHDKSDRVSINDDFGQSLNVERNTIHGWMSEDMNLSKLAHIERALHQARTQAEGQTMAESDNTLRAARARQGSAILTPGIPGNGMMR